MITAKTVDFTYDEVEDRLVLDCKDGAQCQRLLLSRRLARRLITVLAGSLERSSPTVRNAPAGVRREVMALEHVSSLAESPLREMPADDTGLDDDGNDDGDRDKTVTSRSERLAEALIKRVDMDSRSGKFHLLLYGTEDAGDALARLAVNRGEMHRVLAALDHWARRAEWDIDADGGWLQGAEQAAMSAGGRIAC